MKQAMIMGALAALCEVSVPLTQYFNCYFENRSSLTKVLLLLLGWYYSKKDGPIPSCKCNSTQPSSFRLQI